MVDIPATDQNIGLSKAVNRRIAADAAMVQARAALWKFGGMSALAVAIGGGVGLAFWGYSRTLDATASADKIALAISDALSRTTLTTKMDEASRIKLDATDAVVGIDPKTKVDVTGTVGIAPNSKVKVEGGNAPYIPRPTNEQLGQTTETYRGKMIHTNFTVFKTVPFGKGAVITGYIYSGDETAPKTQFCYYSTDTIDQVSLRVNLATDGVYAPPKSQDKTLNTREAASNCVWFDGSPTRY